MSYVRELAYCLLAGIAIFTSSYAPAQSSSACLFLELIGDGDEGLVYHALDANRNSVAIKCHRHLKEGQREFFIGQDLVHPHIVKVYDWFIQPRNEEECSCLVRNSFKEKH